MQKKFSSNSSLTCTCYHRNRCFHAHWKTQNTLCELSVLKSCFFQQNNLCQKSVNTQIHALFCVTGFTKKRGLFVKMFHIIKILKHVSRKNSQLFVVSLVLRVNLASYQQREYGQMASSLCASVSLYVE